MTELQKDKSNSVNDTNFVGVRLKAIKMGL